MFEDMGMEEAVATLEKKLKFVTAKLMLSNYTKLISIVLYRFRFRIDDTRSIVGGNTLACVVWDIKDLETPIPIIFFAPELCVWSETDLAFLVIHEILHVLDRHSSRCNDKKADLWNYACDHVINTRISQDISNGNKVITLPKSAYIIEKLKNKNITAEEAYAYLIKNPPPTRKVKIKIIPGKDGSGDGVSISIGDGDGDGDYLEVEEILNNGKWKQIIKDLVNQHNAGQGIVTQVNDMKSDISGAMEQEPFKSLSKNRGEGSSGITEYLKSIIEIEIPWVEILEKAIKKQIRVISENRSWRMPNKRMRSHGLMIPSRTHNDESKSNLYILADHSASVSIKDLRKMGSLIMQSIGLFEEINIIKHDVSIVGIEQVTISSTEEQINDAICGKGRGGTNHTCVFDYIQNKLTEEYDEPEDIGMVLILTDYQSNIEEIWNSYDWTKKIPAKIILTEPNMVSPVIDPCPILLKPKSEY